MHQHPINPETCRLRPPAQAQPSPVMACIRPGLRPNHGLLQPQPSTPPRPDQQFTGSPVRAIVLPPGLKDERLALQRVGTPPTRAQITARAAAKRFNPLRSCCLEGGVAPGTADMPHRMLSQTQTTVGLHARPQDLRLLGRLLLHRYFRVRLPGERSKPDPQPEGPRGLINQRISVRAAHWTAARSWRLPSCQDRSPLLKVFGGITPDIGDLRNPFGGIRVVGLDQGRRRRGRTK